MNHERGLQSLVVLLFALMAFGLIGRVGQAAVTPEEEPVELQCFTCSTDVHGVPNPSTGLFFWVGVGDTPQEAKQNARAEMLEDLQDAYDAAEGGYECDYCDSTIPSCLKYMQSIIQNADQTSPSPAGGPPYTSSILASFVGFSVCCTECTNPL
jgi:hypothetical protein